MRGVRGQPGGGGVPVRRDGHGVPGHRLSAPSAPPPTTTTPPFSGPLGELPALDAGRRCCVWRFNFREFDDVRDIFASDSIELLRGCRGKDFRCNAEHGVDARQFAELLMSSAVVLNDFVYWVTFHAGYYFGYLLKIVTCNSLPDTYLPTVYDIKHLMKFCNRLHGGQNKLAELLNVDRVGESHQAGSDSLVMSCAFRKLKYSFFAGSTEKYAGVLYGLNAENGVSAALRDVTLFEF